MEELASTAEANPDVDRFLVFDDADQFDDNGLSKLLKRVVDAQVRLAGSAVRVGNLSVANPMQKALRSAGCLLVLRGDDDAAIAGAVGRYRIRPGLEMPPGRGVLIVDGQPAVTQVACLNDQLDRK
jgi:hypothetical protein